MAYKGNGEVMMQRCGSGGGRRCVGGRRDVRFDFFAYRDSSTFWDVIFIHLHATFRADGSREAVEVKSAIGAFWHFDGDGDF